MPGLLRQARPTGGDRELSPNDRTDPGLLRGTVEPRRTVHTIGIEQRECRIAERSGPLDQRFGKRCAAQEAECRSRVEFYIHGRNPGYPLTPNSQPLTLAQRPSTRSGTLGVGGAIDVGRWELSINDPLEKPMVRVALPEHAVRGAIGERHVPLVSIPLMIGRWTI